MLEVVLVRVVFANEVLLYQGVECTVFREMNIVYCARRFMRCGRRAPAIEKMFVSPTGDADPRVLITLGIHQHKRKRETKENNSLYTALHHSVGHLECFGYLSIFIDVCHDPVVKLTNQV
ncbi:unnamed protein product [Schistocephalus solidus]|uniref:Secreted protein n=1 Tax=Schistocephalus solidus TaxID=70667 RepID=A0A183SMH7_SCHSO|nr:unnamed protein product [Schistocephalus solidus]